MSESAHGEPQSAVSHTGLRSLLTTLGRRYDARSRAGIVALFVVVTLCAALGAEVVQRAIGVPFVAWHAALWTAWLVWHSFLFPRARRSALTQPPVEAYRAVFAPHIVPGVSIGVSLMGSAALHALLGGSAVAGPLRMTAALVCCGGGALLLYAGFASIGVASAGFLFEYVESTEPIVARGVYRVIRHPLFLGGVVASVGATLAFTSATALAAAAINVLVLPVYKRLEDRRLNGVFGDSYFSYTNEVAAFVPSLKGRRLISRSSTVQR